METRLFRTLVKGAYSASGKKVKRNAYILGRVSGLMLAFCDYPNNGTDQNTMYMRPITKSAYFLTKCTDEQYARFKEVADAQYPGLCKFDV